LGYQMMKALQGIFRPGHSRYQDKRYKRTDVIRGIRTMRDMCDDAHHFGHFVRQHYPAVHRVHDVTSEMAGAFIQDLADRGRSRAYLSRNRCALRKLDKACRAAKVFPLDREELMPLAPRTPRSLDRTHSTPQAYSPSDAERLIAAIREKDVTVADLLCLMHVSGLRVSEAVYLRADDIRPEECCIVLESNANHTKGGRPRRVTLPPEARPLLEQLRARGLAQPDGHVFAERRQLRMRAKDLVRHTCPKLNITCLGTHGFRKSFAAAEYLRAIRAGATDRQALLIVSHQLGHNRIQVAAYSYVPTEIRVDRLRPGRPRRTPPLTDDEKTVSTHA
jgi:integrase